MELSNTRMSSRDCAKRTNGCLGLLVTLLQPFLSVSQVAAQAPPESPVPAVVSELIGSWVGSGVLFDRPAEFEMQWEITASGFVRLAFRNAFATSNQDRRPVLSAEATYHFRDTTAVGVWVDDRPQQLTLNATTTDTSIVTHWVAPSEQGRTEYIVGRDTVLVRDFVGEPGSERKFADAVYTRTRNVISALALATLFFPQAGAQVSQEETPEIGFSGLATFDIQVRDRGEAIQWLSQVLGFEHLFTEESMNWAEVRSPVQRVTIGIEEVRDRPIRTSNIDFGVRDIEIARTVIEERGGVFVGETTDYGPVVIARLRDPSGNMFNLFQGK